LSFAPKILKGVAMAYRKTFTIRSLPKKEPKVGVELWHETRKHLKRNQGLYRRFMDYSYNPLPEYDENFCITWLSFIYRQVFKNTPSEFCPNDKNCFMVRFAGQADADEVIDKLKKFIKRWQGLKIDIETGG